MRSNMAPKSKPASVTAEALDRDATNLEAHYADDVWRSAAAQHLRAAGNFLRQAEMQDAEAARQAEAAQESSNAEDPS